MYFWTALYIEDNLEEVRDQSIRISEETGVKCPLKFLPLHVSLKIEPWETAGHTHEELSTISEMSHFWQSVRWPAQVRMTLPRPRKDVRPLLKS